MGIDHSPVFGYGVQLTPGECSACLGKLDLETDDDLGEHLAGEFDLDCYTGGCSLSGDIWYIIGPSWSMDDGDATVTLDPEGLVRLQNMIATCGIEKKPGWVLDVHQW